MLGIILSTFLVLIAFVIFIEYKNEKKYQVQRRQKRSTSPKKEKPYKVKLDKVKLDKVKLDKVKLDKEKPNKVKPHTVAPTPSLPKADYVQFSHQRLIDMGLSNEESIEFVIELIEQIESQLPLIEMSLSKYDYHATERLTHSIKGSATNIGIGGVSDLLVDYNTYLKTGSDFSIAEAYFKHLIHYTNELKLHYT